MPIAYKKCVLWIEAAHAPRRVRVFFVADGAKAARDRLCASPLLLCEVRKMYKTRLDIQICPMLKARGIWCTLRENNGQIACMHTIHGFWQRCCTPIILGDVDSNMARHEKEIFGYSERDIMKKHNICWQIFRFWWTTPENVQLPHPKKLLRCCMWAWVLLPIVFFFGPAEGRNLYLMVKNER